MTAPTVVDAKATTFTGSAGSRSTASMSWLAGDIFVAEIVSEDASKAIGTPTTGGSGLTFATNGTANSAASSCWGHKFIATASGSGTGTISASPSAGNCRWGMIVTQYRSHGGLGNVTIVNANSTTTVALTTTADSAVSVLGGDWNSGAAGYTGQPASPTPTELVDNNESGIYGFWGAYWNGVSAGAQNWGVSGAGRDWTWIAVEVLGVASGTPVTGTAVATNAGITATAVAAVDHPATAVSALGGVAATAVGAVDHTGAAVSTMGGVVAAVVGAVDHTGAGVAALGGIAATAVVAGGGSSITGTALATLGGITATATGTYGKVGVAAATLGGVQSTASGVPGVLGVAAATLGPSSAVVVGGVDHTGTAVGVLGGIVAGVSSSASITGAAEATLGGLSSTARQLRRSGKRTLLGSVFSDPRR
jgi:hypothetical protein